MRYNRDSFMSYWVWHLRAGLYRQRMPQHLWQDLTTPYAKGDLIITYNSQLDAIYLRIPIKCGEDIVRLMRRKDAPDFFAFTKYMLLVPGYGSSYRDKETPLQTVNTFTFMTRYLNRLDIYDLIPKHMFNDMAVRSQEFLFIYRTLGEDNNVIYTVFVPLSKAGHIITYSFKTPNTIWPYDMGNFYDFIDEEFDIYTKDGRCLYDK